ncbi:hypothetical protein EV182_007249, partial [Spiromyces aspiralis]
VINAYLQRPLVCGSSWVREPATPRFKVETHPLMDGLERPIQVQASSEFSFEVEGLLVDSEGGGSELLSRLVRQIQVSVWLSDKPWAPWGWDGRSFYKRHLIAHPDSMPGAARHSSNDRDRGDEVTYFADDAD